MEQNLSITIGKPCSEKFNQFKQTETGGFCNSCKKDVVDFRNMSDEKLITYFKSKDGNTCGYFKTSQLKMYSELAKPSNVRRLHYLRIVGLAFISMLSLHSIQAQDNIPKTEVVQKANKEKEKTVITEGIQNELLSGIVSDESSPLPGVNILLKGTSIGTSTNFDGEFEFPKVLKEGDILVFSYLGFKAQSITIKKAQAFLKIKMIEDTLCMLGEVEVNEVYTSKRTLWQKIKGIF